MLFFIIFFGLFSQLADSQQVTKYTLKNGMTIEVYQPEDYDPTKTYPLLLFNDGEVIFHPQGWSFDKKLNQFISDSLIEPIIVAAVYNDGERNTRYVPYKDKRWSERTGIKKPGAKDYAKNLIKYVIPAIQKNYSVNEERIGVMGASLGGLISTWLGIHYPETFQYSIALSPSFWFKEGEIFKEAEKKASDFKHDQIFWFDMGTREWSNITRMQAALGKGDLETGNQIFYYEASGASHTRLSWISRVHLPLIAVFGNQPSELDSMNVKLECIQYGSNPVRSLSRINAKLHMDNGAAFSAARSGIYEAISGRFKIYPDGGFVSEDSLGGVIKVSYQEFTEELTIPPQFCLSSAN